MTQTIVKGYTVIYDKKDGTIGFIGSDTSSGGYPWFSCRLDSVHVYPDITRTLALLKQGQNMRGSDSKAVIKFDTMRIVEYTQVFSDIDIDIDRIVFNSAMQKLTEAEIAAVRQFINVTEE